MFQASAADATLKPHVGCACMAGLLASLALYGRVAASRSAQQPGVQSSRLVTSVALQGFRKKVKSWLKMGAGADEEAAPESEEAEDAEEASEAAVAEEKPVAKKEEPKKKKAAPPPPEKPSPPPKAEKAPEPEAPEDLKSFLMGR